MASRIEYLVGYDRNYYQGLHSFPGSWSAHDEPPEDLDLILHIRLDNMISTENVGTLYEHEAEYRWDMLAPGIDRPDDISMNTAVAFAEAIWLDTLMGSHDRTAASDFAHGICTVVDSILEEWGDISKHYEERFNEILRLGEDEGAVHRVRAWASGVPLEDVLAG